MDNIKEVSIDDFVRHPWQSLTRDSVVIKQFGQCYVAKLNIKDKHFGDRTIFRIYELSTEALPDRNAEPFCYGLALLDGILHKDGKFYKPPEHRLFPVGGRASILDLTKHNAWRNVCVLRYIEICNVVFPESMQAFYAQNQMTILTNKRMTTRDLDDMNDAGIDLDQYLGWKVFHEIFGTGTLTLCTAPGKEKNLVKWNMQCMRNGCKKKVTVYTGSGLHSGAWCYVFDKKSGDYVCNLRDDRIFCKNH